MRYELKSIGIWAFIKIAFFLNMIVGFVFGLFYAMFMIIFLAMAASMPFMDLPGVDPEALNPGIIFVTMPLMFSFIGAVFITMFELIVLAIYNLFSRFLGGLELKLEPIQPDSATRAQSAMPPAAAMPPLAPPPPPPTDYPSQVAPLIPVTPSVSVTPSEPIVPVTPAVPKVPIVPDAPTIPVAPRAPVSPVFPVAPVAPDAPATKQNRADGSPDDRSDENLPPRAPDAPDA